MQTFTTTAPITAVLDIPAGRIQLIATDRTDTTVEVRPADPAKNRDVQAAERAVVSCTDGVLRIHTTPPKNELTGSGSLEVSVKLPAGSSLEARTAGSELRTVGRLGDITFDGAYRHIKIDEATSLHLTAVDGDVEVARLTGPARITTARGDITVTEAHRGTLDLRTQYGHIAVAATPGAWATLHADTTLGTITDTLKNNGTTELTIHATTAHGDITARAL
ncbi:DUF4097 family beta strand repeat-containing protein [Kitasatospora sp. NPDC002227]|uniref:DUF4097 family beta strand repeat-containing protein n=1 Tax=Kitasatospora sp. NPDC002227 TaxID=3154773 RepID=UPI003322FCB8